MLYLYHTLYLAPIFALTKRNRLHMPVSGGRVPCLNYSNLRQANESAAQTASRRPDVKAKTSVLRQFPPTPFTTPSYLSAFLFAHPPDQAPPPPILSPLVDRETKLFRGIGCFRFDSTDAA